MNLKHIKLLTVAAIINTLLGIFLIICGLLEFTGILYTNANTTIESVGVQLSYLVFISGALVFTSGLITLFMRRTMTSINLLILLGVVALAWPIFVSISLFFSQLIICIRLLPTMLSSLFYIIAILIVKVTNESLQKTHKFNPTAHVEAMVKKKSTVNVTKALSGGSGKAKSSVDLKSLGNLAQATGKRRSGPSIGKLFYSGSRRSHGGFGKMFYSGSRKRGKFRIRKR
ncbi:MAG: hypothetical protein PUD92_00270 [Clostridiales bacterium]|nr:hypothetical protein [Clostridiales bacterium]